MNSFALVQDPFGNYVVQYIRRSSTLLFAGNRSDINLVDLGEPAFINPLVSRFLGNIPLLLKQKFSSNVIEKVPRHIKGTVLFTWLT